MTDVERAELASAYEVFKRDLAPCLRNLHSVVGLQFLNKLERVLAAFGPVIEAALAEADVSAHIAAAVAALAEADASAHTAAAVAALPAQAAAKRGKRKT